MPSLWNVQKAIYAALTGDAPLMALVEGVYDHVPQSSDFEFVVIGDDESSDFDDDREAGFDTVATVHVWTRLHRGRKVLKDIQAEVHRVLHRNLLSVTAANTVETFIELTDSFLEPDGVTYHGVQRCRIITMP